MKSRVIIAALAAALVLAGCGSNGDADLASDDHAHIDPLNPDHMAPEQVATTAMGVILSWKPTEDASPTDAFQRARRWLGGKLRDAANVTTTAPSGVRPDPRWVSWRESRDVISAACVRSDSTPAAPEGMRTLVIDVTCRQNVLHVGGAITPLTPETWRTTVTRTGDGWLLTDYRFLSTGSSR